MVPLVSSIPPTETDSRVDNITFADLGLPAALRRVCEDLGFTTPTDIQAQAIPALLDGRDVTGVAQTGTGKTAAFGMPLLAHIADNAYAYVGAPQALVLTPTRELALQVADAIESFATYLPDVRVLAVYGGAPYPPQQRALRDGVQVVVGTPGRIMDHMERGNLSLDEVRFLVLDEADEMLRMGFAEDVDTIVAKAPEQRQVALFSATMPPAIRTVAENHLTDPLAITVARHSPTVSTVHQSYAVVPFRHKVEALTRILAVADTDATIVFCRTKSAAEEVGSALIEKGITAATISGDVPQKERERIVERLRNGTLDVLVATDVAARGLDVDRIGLVVNFDIPREAETYVHRIGRTGRAGRQGRAISFITPHERGKLKQIEKTIKQHIDQMEIPSPREVAVHKARTILSSAETRKAAGRLDLYSQLVREALVENDSDIVDADAAVELASVLLALAVGDDGLQGWAKAESRSGDRLVRDDDSSPKRRGRDSYDQDVESQDFNGKDRSYRDRGQGSRRPGEPTRYRISVGHKDRVNPGGIVGAITSEGGLRGSDIGKIDIFPSFSLVHIAADLSRDQVDRISRVRVAGRPLRMTVDKGGPRVPHGDRKGWARQTRQPRHARLNRGA